MSDIPRDPIILLSYMNTQLRDFYSTLEELCTEKDLDIEFVIAQMKSIDYHYDSCHNQFN